MHIITVSVGQESGHGLMGSLLQSHIGCDHVLGWGCRTISGFDWGRISFRDYSVVVDRMQFFTGCWMEGLSSSLAFALRLPSFPYCMDLSNMVAAFIHVCKVRRQQRDPERWKSQLFIT